MEHYNFLTFSYKNFKEIPFEVTQQTIPFVSSAKHAHKKDVE